MKLLSKDEIENNLDNLNGWSYINNSIQKIFELNNFSAAIAFIVQIGIEAERIDHHPEIHLHGWNKVTIKLSTHSVNGITEKDFNLAHQIERLH